MMLTNKIRQIVQGHLHPERYQRYGLFWDGILLCGPRGRNHPEDIDTGCSEAVASLRNSQFRYPMPSIEYNFSIAFSRALACSMN